MKILLAAVTLAMVCMACAGTAPYVYQRTYLPGESYRYKMVRTYHENGEFKRAEVAESIHVVPADGAPRERIHFASLTKRTDQGTEDLSEEIGKFPEYEVTLAQVDNPKALSLPDIKGWDMGVVGPVTDLHTFLVAISPQVGSDKVTLPGATHVQPEPVRGNWANGDSIPVGEDCIQISVELVELTGDSVVYETRFLPPAAACLEPLKPWMEDSVVEGSPNNFQQQMAMGPMAAAMWGREEFTVRSTVRRSDGLILRATMDNPLTLRLKVACDQNLDDCKHEMPMTIRRELTLELVQ